MSGNSTEELSRKCGNAKKKIGNMSTEIEGRISAKNSDESALQAATAEAAQLQHQIDSLEAEFSSLQSQASAAASASDDDNDNSSEVQAIYSQMLSVQSELSARRAEKEKKEAEKEALRKKIREHESYLQSLLQTIQSYWQSLEWLQSEAYHNRTDHQNRERELNRAAPARFGSSASGAAAQTRGKIAALDGIVRECATMKSVLTDNKHKIDDSLSRGAKAIDDSERDR